MLHPLHDAAAQLEPGEVGKPFGFGGSLYIIQVIERRAPAPLSFEVVAPTIRDLLRKQRHDELSRQLQERLLEDADLVIYRQVLDGYLDELARRQSGEESVPGARGAD